MSTLQMLLTSVLVGLGFAALLIFGSPVLATSVLSMVLSVTLVMMLLFGKRHRREQRRKER